MPHEGRGASGFGDGGFGGGSGTCRDASAPLSNGRTACCATLVGFPTAAFGSEIASEAARRLLHHGALHVPIIYLLQNKSGGPFGAPN